MRKVIYVVNEVKGVTEGLRTSTDINVVRDYKGNGKSFVAVSLSQPTDVSAVIITNNHRFEMKQVEISGGQRRFFTKDSEAIRIASNLYHRGIEFTLINYQGNTRTKIIITPEDNFYNKIDEFCGIEKVVSHFGYKDRNGKIVDGFKKSEITKHKITWSEMVNTLGSQAYKTWHDKERFNKALEVFTKNAELYGLDNTSTVDMITFTWMVSNSHPDFLETDRFKCPHCGNIVRVNGHEEFIKGKPVNTGETICEYCYTEFDIHDKQDVMDMYYSKIFNK